VIWKTGITIDPHGIWASTVEGAGLITSGTILFQINQLLATTTSFIIRQSFDKPNVYLKQVPADSSSNKLTVAWAGAIRSGNPVLPDYTISNNLWYFVAITWTNAGTGQADANLNLYC